MSGVEILVKDINSPITDKLLSPDFCTFLSGAVTKFGDRIRNVFIYERQLRVLKHDFKFLSETKHIRHDLTWKVVSSPKCLECPVVDLGDVDPSNQKQLDDAFNSAASGVQVDFDDGFCPNWKNVLTGHLNVFNLCRRPRNNKTAPKLKFRPRSWNMIEENILVNGSQILGALFDFALHMFHNGSILAKQDQNIFFYLPKLESYHEAAVWASMFDWAESSLGLPTSTIRGIVLIESISAAFEMEEILYELRRHCGGLNCGIWDYSASFITRFGTPKDSDLFPDRTKYCSMDSAFLSSYRSLLVEICKKRGASSTGGMFALTGGPPNVLSSEHARQVDRVLKSKASDFKCGTDGGLVYDPALASSVISLFSQMREPFNPSPIDESKIGLQLISFKQNEGLPSYEGFCRNIEVSFRFVLSWVRGQGHLILHNQVEDSATAEISRAQIWQQLQRSALLHISTVDNSELPALILGRLGVKTDTIIVNGKLIKTALDETARLTAKDDVASQRTSQQSGVATSNKSISSDFSDVLPPSLSSSERVKSDRRPDDIAVAYHLTLELLTAYQCPLFITSWLQQRGVLSGEVLMTSSKL